MSTRAATPPVRRSRLRRLGLALLAAVLPTLAALLVAAPPAQAATLTEIRDFGANPSNLGMHLYVPDTVQDEPPVLVAVHYCTGSGPAFYSGTQFASLADQYGFVVIYPSATREGQCFDVSSPQALTRNGGSDPVGIRSMISYVETHHNADPDRIFVTGASSGAMMTNVLLGNYPDVFQAGAAFMGVPFGCFATTDGSGWNSQCANGQISRTPQEWGDIARAAYPGYTGPRPRMQLWHGTQDAILHHNNLGEEIKQWTNVLGVSQTPALTDSPQPNWTRTRYGNAGEQAPVEAISISGMGHDLPGSGMAERAIAFFGLDEPTGNPGPDPDPDPAACAVTATTNAWNTGLTAEITVSNTGDTALDDWRLTFSLPAGQAITAGWNAHYSAESGAVTATGVAHNATIPPGGSVTLGYQASHGGTPAAPTGFALNGTACA
ncbi:PHB depolymerase family esterase [Streptomyces sp. 3MP-14]|uniref:PHB depolymerase family esterase n=1 Tax=Streptomyces mimosae TaxID=2586635 RepID=A0A5N6ACZ0_9ACTN|nr:MULTISPECIES: PHB depolymerase family esterase [Streptomyces]KAB8166521.1 PHB depolymerase family esterase [Streptomyces mimosae]KAB8178950.1 PHB depolymerase family esterase [Streptomyces sp. 3MP-14]